jgi:hypothetical protein
VPSEIEWFANRGNPRTRRAYENAIQDFNASPASGGPTSFAA